MRPMALCCLTLTLTLAQLLVSACSRSALVVEGPVGCIEGEIALTRAYPTVTFLLDRSQSMNAPIYGQGFAGTRWDALGSALATALPTIESSAQIGALLFPMNATPGNCWVSDGPELAPALGNAASVLSMLEQNAPGGATPTYLAIEKAANAILAIRTTSSARALVLATDGGPDCNMGLDVRSCRCTVINERCQIPAQCLDDKRTIDLLAMYRARGVFTYVIGIQSAGDSAFSDVLDAMAVAGGRPQVNAPQKYYAARSTEELNAAMAAISDLVGACVFLTASVPDKAGSIALNLDGSELHASQWSWQDRDNGEIVLAPAVCTQVRAEASPKLTARVTCGDKDAGVR